MGTLLASVALPWYALILTGAVGLWYIRTPRHDRTWVLDHARLPQVSIVRDEYVTVTNVRDFSWTGATSAEPAYRTGRIRLSDLSRVDFVVAHYAGIDAVAHTFVTFVCTNGDELVFSFEARRMDGAQYSALKGLFRQFELMCVVGTPRDVVGVRVEHRHERVYRYPTTLDRAQVRTLFMTLAQRVNAIYARPEFYNTFTNNCMSVITRALADILGNASLVAYRAHIPLYFHSVLYKLALIDTTHPYVETKRRARVHPARVEGTHV
jgi:hypothetical protein